ncbi:LOW QUALITY PROTEIN: putative cancer susceptibility gene HEPN1 protein [Carlito syrichta]|uniref:LOW QUALITY PROTEIN: putative cancer susceptibility gene HEPN1 protein n=1 Tax=Carlito syrichta TaxID=1868482 RepID=A0A1U7TI09_CARSF|nr:LOW QUALITY PROTEIN: putative cancer susceptibility gene HEPN1 protein [Carlito syrichta]
MHLKADQQGGKLELEFRRLGGARGLLEALEKRGGQNTQRSCFSFCFLIGLSPLHTTDYCFSYELFKKWWHGHRLIIQWPIPSLFWC